MCHRNFELSNIVILNIWRKDNGSPLLLLSLFTAHKKTHTHNFLLARVCDDARINQPVPSVRRNAHWYNQIGILTMATHEYYSKLLDFLFPWRALTRELRRLREMNQIMGQRFVEMYERGVIRDEHFAGSGWANIEDLKRDLHVK